MKIIYRACPFLSETAVDWTNKKFEIFRKSLISFIQAGANPADILFVLDRCNKDYIDIINIVAPNSQIDAVAFNVKRDSIIYSLGLMPQINAEKILIIEDDYLWKKDSTLLARLEKALDRFQAVTPYDHPDHYHTLAKNHYIEVFDNQLWRNCHTTTHTFAVRKETFINYIDDFHYGLHDWIMWTKLMNASVDLFSAIPSMATHLAKGHLALGEDWEKRFNEL